MGWTITGGVPTFGSAAACVIRSATIWRARYRSVPSSNVRSIAESPGMDCDSIVFEPRDAVEQVLLQRRGDELLDLLGGQSERLGLHLDRRRLELGIDVQRRVVQLRQPEREDGDDAGHHQAPHPHRGIHQPAHHWAPPVVSAGVPRSPRATSLSTVRSATVLLVRRRTVLTSGPPRHPSGRSHEPFPDRRPAPRGEAALPLEGR